jgi:hypothetical protein
VSAAVSLDANVSVMPVWSFMDEHGLANADEEAEEAIERWEKDAEMADTPPTPSGALQRLLSEHHSICEEIMDIRNKAIERNYGDHSPEDN